MAIDLKTQRVYNLRDAAKAWPNYRTGKPSHQSKVLRAILKGTSVGNQRICLDGLCLSGQWVTTLEAIQEYGERIAAAKIKQQYDATPAVRTPAAQSRAAERAGRELDKIGI